MLFPVIISLTFHPVEILLCKPQGSACLTLCISFYEIVLKCFRICILFITQLFNNSVKTLCIATVWGCSVKIQKDVVYTVSDITDIDITVSIDRILIKYVLGIQITQVNCRNGSHYICTGTIILTGAVFDIKFLAIGRRSGIPIFYAARGVCSFILIV